MSLSSFFLASGASGVGTGVCILNACQGNPQSAALAGGGAVVMALLAFRHAVKSVVNAKGPEKPVTGSAPKNGATLAVG